MSKSIELENEITFAIERIIATKEDEKEIKTYFENVMVNDLIDGVMKVSGNE